MHELEVVEMEDERLATAGCHPEREFAEIVIVEEEIGREVLFLDKIIGILVQFIEESLRTLEIAIENDFSVEKPQVLEISKGDREIPMAVDAVHIASDSAIVSLKIRPDPGIEAVP